VKNSSFTFLCVIFFELASLRLNGIVEFHKIVWNCKYSSIAFDAPNLSEAESGVGDGAINLSCSQYRLSPNQIPVNVQINTIIQKNLKSLKSFHLKSKFHKKTYNLTQNIHISLHFAPYNYILFIGSYEPNRL
jgi:hypothetical protein